MAYLKEVYSDFRPEPTPNDYRFRSEINKIESDISKEWPVQPVLRKPTLNNPFSNVPPTSFGRPQVFKDYQKSVGSDPSSKNVRNLMENNFVAGLYQNPADKLFDRENSQRQFYSVPVGSVPSDQTKFAESLYGVDYNCKAGSIWMDTGVKFTDDSLMCTGFNVSTPTNFGQINE